MLLNCSELEDKKIIDKALTTLDKIKSLVGPRGLQVKQVMVHDDKWCFHTNLESLGRHQVRNGKDKT